jgi:signal transduction histidine kinase
MNKIKVIIKIPFFFYLVALFTVKETTTYGEVIILLLILAVNIFKERFSDSISLVLICFALILAGIVLYGDFGILLCVLIFDFVYKKAYVAIIPILAIAFYFFFNKDLPLLLLIMSICSICAYEIEKSERRELVSKNSLDEERFLRYELEKTRAKLLASVKETAHLTEVSERNRIAREIHDNLGHSISGILIQLQAAYKIYDLNGEKSKDILKKSINGLSDSVTLIRDTVHNIKPKENLGIEYINTIINDFSFCTVALKFSGDFNIISSEHLGILGSNIKEALTNAARYSNASKIDITIDINENFTRLYIKDNGRGCSKIKEGMGLSGMKERIGNIGGSISISSENGFMIVCLIPVRTNVEGGKLFEDSYRR